MTDDILTRLTTQEMTTAFYKAFPTVVTLEDAMRQALEAADEIERLRETLRVMSDHVLEVREEIRQFRTITGNYMRNHNEVAGEKVKGYVNSEIIPEELWLLALTYRTQHAGNYDQYAERRQTL